MYLNIEGYMVSIYDKTLCKPYLKKGLIRGINIAINL